MTFIRIKEQVDHISETWRDGTPEELRTHLADLDTALSALRELETDSPDTTDPIDELRGRVEVLMDEFDISLGIELPASIGMPDEFRYLHARRSSFGGRRRVGGALMDRNQSLGSVASVRRCSAEPGPL